MTKNKIFFIPFFLLLIFLIVYRSPCYFFQEGYWQIESFEFYIYSLENSFFKSILYIYPEANYFELTLNIVSKLGTYFPNYSALIDVYFALSIKLGIFLYIYFSDSIIFNEQKYKILAILLVLFSPPMTPEVWLTTLHAKAYFGILSFILIFQNFDNLESYKKNAYRSLIIFSGLSSIYASIFAPIYFLKYLIKNNRDNFINFLSSLIPLLINLFIFIIFSNDNKDRFSFDIGKIESFSYNILIRPFFGSSIPKFFHNNLTLENNEFIFIAFFLIVIFLILILYKIYQKKDEITLLIFCSFLLQTVFVFVGSLYGDFVGGRYAVIPGIIILILFIRLFQLEENYFFKGVFGTLILISLIIGFIEFKHFAPLHYMLNCKI
tara:strand:+ start:400 stop:1536 length:1137 start_codon:yes stop_codon:yes gene_type:complete